MHKILYLHAKLWLLTLLLSSVTFFSYYTGVTGDPLGLYWKLSPVLYLVFLAMGILLFRDKIEVHFKNQWHSLFIFSITLLNLLMVMYFGLPKYYYVLGTSISQLVIFIISLLLFLLVKPNVLNTVLNRYYFVAFVIGISFLFLTEKGYFGRNEVLNSNTWGLFVAPFLIYLFIKQKRVMTKALIYIVGFILLYLTGARTTLSAFATLPLFIFLFKKLKRPRMIYTLLLAFGLLFIYLSAYADNALLYELLSTRDRIWLAYIENSTASFSTLITGSGIWKIPSENHEAHNTFLSLLNYNGLLALLLYVGFIVFGMRRKSTNFTVSDGMVFLAVTFQFAESNIPQFSYLFPSFIFLTNMLLNKQSEDVEMEDL
ncbi:hypothetical protein [Sutcliffiella halmapala]|uniref:hypothetical protein n=1 Tax=Sutcliffiella halmapala TaxID=79882 RepID=UPI000994AD27|nr:hypothetical protein [Sutcliffiella halmapala]